MTPPRLSRIVVASLVTFVVAAGCAKKDKSEVPAGDGRVEIGALAPAYRAVTLDGDSVSLQSQGGKVTLLNVWATWCSPCRAEIPELQAIHQRYRLRGLQLVGVSIDADGNDAVIREFVKEFNMQFPVWRDPEERVLTTFVTVGVPTTVLIDRKGIIRWRQTGPVAPGDAALTSAIEAALRS